MYENKDNWTSCSMFYSSSPQLKNMLSLENTQKCSVKLSHWQYTS